MLLGEMDRPDGEDHVTLRDGQRYVQRVVAGGALDLGAGRALRPDRTYLVTGGMGGLGRRAARRLVGVGRGTSRSWGGASPRPRAAEELRRSGRSGAEIAIFIADVSIEEDAARVLDAIAREMPPLAGVVHAAGLPGDSVLLRHTWEQFAAILAAKVQGLVEPPCPDARDLSLDFCVYFSSLAATAPARASQSSYAAANAFLDALAHHPPRAWAARPQRRLGPILRGRYAGDARSERPVRRRTSSASLPISASQDPRPAHRAGRRPDERRLGRSGQPHPWRSRRGALSRSSRRSRKSPREARGRGGVGRRVAHACRRRSSGRRRASGATSCSAMSTSGGAGLGVRPVELVDPLRASSEMGMDSRLVDPPEKPATGRSRTAAPIDGDPRLRRA